MKFTSQQIQEYLTDNTKQYRQYKDTCEYAEKIDIHINGTYPQQLIEERRPNESDSVKDYRKKIYVPITKDVPARVLSSLQKIRKSDDWLIIYPENENKIIADEETLKEYCEEYFPGFTSVTNYMFSVYLQAMAADANAICVVAPITFEISDTEYYKPIPNIFYSKQIIDYKQGKYLIAHNSDHEYKKIYFITDEEIIIYGEKKLNEYTLELSVANPLGYLPAYRVGGEYIKVMDGNIIWDSILNAMVPYLDEAVREYSDLQASVVTSIFMEKWAWSSQNCKTCNGLGMVQRGDKSIKCSACKGEGSTATPYSSIIIKPSLPGSTPAPIPPAGYISKPIEIVSIQNARIKEHKYNALAAVNHQFLDAIPLNNSGIAKSVDRDELNTFANWVAELLVQGMDNIYKFICDWRYYAVVTDVKKRHEMLPEINVPTRFELLSSDYLINEIKVAREAGVSPVLLNTMELEYANKKTNMPHEVKEAMAQAMILDPLTDMTNDEKLTALQNKGITELDYVMSCNINQFVKEAMIQIPKFSDMPYEKKVTLMTEKAQAKIKQNSAANSIMTDANAV